MGEKLRVVARAKGGRRKMCPHALGYGSSGEERVLVYQFDGFSASGLGSGGWRCFAVADLVGMELEEGSWCTGGGHSRGQSCVKVVHLEVR